MATSRAACLALAALLALAAPAHAARVLRQYTGSMTAPSTDKSLYQVARTVNAQAVSTQKSIGVQQNEVDTASISAQRWYPGPMSKASASVTTGTTSDVFEQDGAIELPAAAWGAAAIADTINGGVAVAGANSMVLAEPEGSPGAARGLTMPVFNPQPLAGVGKQGKVQVSSIGTNYIPANAYGQSELGDGPNAVAHAGFAVAASLASKDHPELDLPKGGMGIASSGFKIPHTRR